MNYSYLNSDLEDSGQVRDEPMHMLSMRTAIDLSKNPDFHIRLRYVGDVTAIYKLYSEELYEIDAYAALDLLPAFRPDKHWELSLVGQNLTDSGHMEFVQESFIQATEVPRNLSLLRNLYEKKQVPGIRHTRSFMFRHPAAVDSSLHGCCSFR